MALLRALGAPFVAAGRAGAWAFQKDTVRGSIMRAGLRHLGPGMGGAAIGGTIGAFRGDVSGEARLGEIFKHAALGAVGGVGLQMGWKAGRGAFRANQFLGRGKALQASWEKKIWGKAWKQYGERAAGMKGNIERLALRRAAETPATTRSVQEWEAMIAKKATRLGGYDPQKYAKNIRKLAERRYKETPLGRDVLVGGVDAFMHSPGVAAAGMGARGAATLATRAGRFAFEHPVLVGGGALAVGGGLYAAGRGGATPGSSPTMMGRATINYNQQAIAADMSGGIAPMGVMGSAEQFQQYQEYQTYKERLKNSAQGLVQGLHRGRHG